MNYQGHQMPKVQNREPINYTMLTEPFFAETLKKAVGQSVVIETVRGNLQGILTDVKMDHVVVKSYDSDTVFYVRVQQIVHVMPS
ncbi:MAG: hypothetical protein K0S71_1910 [Clostridia bacterium]|jgi:hypothetical protein|nr:hypothetical protein [Clostridia bacterium]